VLGDPDVAAAFGMHISTDLPTGKFAYRYGALMASVDRFRVTITGKQSHAAMPWNGVDPIVAAAHVVTAVQTIASRKIDARKPVVVSIGILRAGQAWNIIPREVGLEGTIRTHDDDVRRRAVEEFSRIVGDTASAHGATAEIELDDYGPVVWNDPDLGRQMTPSLVRAAGEGNVVETEPVMGGEDFAQYALHVPGFFVFLGVRNEAIGAVHAVHTPHLIVDEAALPIGVRAHCLFALDYLDRASRQGARGNGRVH
jgi:amidohydrolase